MGERGRGRDRAPGVVWPRAQQREELEEAQDPGPESKSTAVGTQGGSERDTSSSAAGEQIDRCCQKRQQTGDQHDLDGPPANEARAEIQIRGRSLRELE